MLAVPGLPPEAEVRGPTGLEGMAGGGDAGTGEQGGPPPSGGTTGPGEAGDAGEGSGADGADQKAVRLLVRVPRSRASTLAAALRAGQGVRSARKDAGSVRVQLDPADLI